MDEDQFTTPSEAGVDGASVTRVALLEISRDAFGTAIEPQPIRVVKVWDITTPLSHAVVLRPNAQGNITRIL